VAVSQSGETADTLAALRLAKSKGVSVLAVTNTIGSAISREADYNLYTRCGPELGVASTKAFTGQLTALFAFALHMGLSRKTLTQTAALALAKEAAKLPALIRSVLGLEEKVREIAKHFFKSANFIFIGRRLNYPIALEAALKLKEISYIHAEGFAAGELKHGSIALVDEEMSVVAIATRSPVFEKTISNCEEIRARGGRLIILKTKGDPDVRAEHVLELPVVSEMLAPIVSVIPLQMLAYYIAALRGLDIDQPRNLAKSVTVE
jgi:glucosamine--fructose-6-phosphate aminotransferase (isomerizing)